MWSAIKSDLFEFVATVQEEAQETISKVVDLERRSEEEELKISEDERVLSDFRNNFGTYSEVSGGVCVCVCESVCERERACECECVCVSCVVTVLVVIARHCHVYNNAVTGTSCIYQVYGCCGSHCVMVVF
jgi:hypothetical protein